MSHPSDPQFWNDRYTAGTTPWDLGGVPPRLAQFLTEHRTGGRVLIPGCGTGYEVAVFHQAGFDVTALDFAPAAVARARANLGPDLGTRVLLGDFFQHPFAPQSFDFVYERTFFCAIPPSLRAAYVQRMIELLRPAGVLVGLFYHGDERDGPPYQLNESDHATFFPPHFALTLDEAVAQPFPLFGANERWREYRRRP
ncbi:MAG: methyltransferase domain-containing protein [Candidatus Didemnitutus sp.]|nr:methyltransferase domain-containing protein [Candidatus Didemnitutus sp.]